MRGTLNWHTRDAGRYPGITRPVGSRVSGRRVRLEHVAWLTPRHTGAAGGLDSAQHLFYELTAECHARTLTLHLADYAADASRRLQQPLTHIRRALTRISIPPVAPAYAPLMYRRI